MFATSSCKEKDNKNNSDTICRCYHHKISPMPARTVATFQINNWQKSVQIQDKTSMIKPAILLVAFWHKRKPLSCFPSKSKSPTMGEVVQLSSKILSTGQNPAIDWLISHKHPGQHSRPNAYKDGSAPTNRADLGWCWRAGGEEKSRWRVVDTG